MRGQRFIVLLSVREGFLGKLVCREREVGGADDLGQPVLDMVIGLELEQEQGSIY